MDFVDVLYCYDIFQIAYQFLVPLRFGLVQDLLGKDEEFVNNLAVLHPILQALRDGKITLCNAMNYLNLLKILLSMIPFLKS